MKRKVLIVTERRADYSKFRPVIAGIKKSTKLDYILVVTGSHLLKASGSIREIQRDGYKISAKFDMYPKNRTDTGADMAYSVGKAMIKLTEIISKSKPDIVLSGFDIGADLAAAIVGAHMNIPVAHLEAGDVTGNIDEPIRHAISKFAHLHFTTNRSATERLIRMGEDKRRIFTVGNPSLDAIKKIHKIPISDLEREFELDLEKPLVIVMQHTVVTELDRTEMNIKPTLDAIKELGIQTLLIHGNADAGSNRMIRMIKRSGIRQIKTIQFEKYINLLGHAAAIVGNSSSGKMEAPFMRVPSVNIGTRQSRRPKAASVIDAGYDKDEIKKAIKKAVGNKRFIATVKRQRGLYGDGNTSERIIRILETIDLEKLPIQKTLTY